MTMRLTLVMVPLVAVAVPAGAQTMDHSSMPGMHMPSRPAAKRATPTARPPRPAPAQTAPASDPNCPPEHAAMGHCAAAAASPQNTDVPAARDMPDAAPATPSPSGTALPAGDRLAPAAPEADYANRIWGAQAMGPARAALRSEHGGRRFSQVMLNLAEYQVRDGRDGYRWDGEGWFGGDVDRLTIKSEGEGALGEGADAAEIQALYSRAVGPYFNLQAGLRHDVRPTPTRSYATIGLEGLAPYWFDVEAAVFLSTKGEVLGRLEAYYDQRITQRLILQPRVELNFSAQDIPQTRTGAGLVDVDFGIRLRYEITREFAPYVGLSYEAKSGRTARFSRVDGDDPTSPSVVAGARFWF